MAVAAPLLIVLDWADSRPREILALIDAAGAATASPVRVLLLGRRAGEWWEMLPFRTSDAASDVLAAGSILSLASLVFDEGTRLQHFHAAVDAFAGVLGHERPSVELVPEFEQVIYVHTAALHAVIDASEGRTPHRAPADLFEDLMLREDAAFWDVTAPAFLEGPSARTSRIRLLAAVTLVGPRTEDEARELFGRVPDIDASQVNGALLWARSLYPSEIFLEPLRPDRLGEALVAAALKERSDYAALLLPEEPRARWGVHLLTVLNNVCRAYPSLSEVLARLLQGRIEYFMAAAKVDPDPGIGHALASAIAAASSTQVAELYGRRLLDLDSRALAEATSVALNMQIEASTSDDDRAFLLMHVSRSLQLAGKSAEARKSVELSISAWRVLARDGDRVMRWMLATQLVNYAAVAEEEEANAEARINMAREAIELLEGYRGVPDEVVYWLGRAWSAASRALDALGQTEEAVKSGLESIRILESLDTPRFKVDLGRQYVTYARLWSRIGDDKTAQRWAARGVATLQPLATVDLKTAGPELAQALSLKASILRTRGKLTKALEVADANKALCEQLAAEGDSEYRGYFRIACRARGEILEDLDYLSEAAQEWLLAASVSFELSNSDASEAANLVRDLSSASRLLRKAGRPLDAREQALMAASVTVPPPTEASQFWPTVTILMELADRLEEANEPEAAGGVRMKAYKMPMPAGVQVEIPDLSDILGADPQDGP